MADEGFRRAEDKQWRESVETRLITLVSAQKTADDDIDELATQVEACEELLHGDRRERDSGIVGQLNAIEAKVNSLLAILHPDSTGQSGLIREHNEIKRKVLGRERTTENAWKFWTAVVVALVAFLGILVQQNWTNLTAYWKAESVKSVAAQRKIDRAKRPKPRSAPRVKAEAPVETPDDNSPVVP